MFAGRLHIWGNKLPSKVPDSTLSVPLYVPLTLNMFVEDLSSAVSFISFQGPLILWCLVASSAGWSVSGSEHVVVFSFVMPWVLCTSWGRYRMEGNQESDSGPANRLDVQVLENLCYHRASQGYTSVQGPLRRLNMDAKSSLISQICFCSNIHVLFSGTSISLVTLFGMKWDLTPPQLMECVTVIHTGDISLCGYFGSSMCFVRTWFWNTWYASQISSPL